jgi:hypothetical protein
MCDDNKTVNAAADDNVAEAAETINLPNEPVEEGGKEFVTAAKRPKRASMSGSIAANLHEGSRSEYLAQFVFSSFGTAIPVPHQEDSGLDIYCTLLERVGQRAWPRAYYSVQVKSTMEPWVFDSAESVRWIIEHPLPIFLCIVQKSEARILVYQTSPRFAAWVLPSPLKRLELIPGMAKKARSVEWGINDTFELAAPILSFTIQEILDRSFRDQVADVLKLWIGQDMDNLFRIKSGIHHFQVPADYETNATTVTGWVDLGGGFRKESLPVAQRWLKELMGHLATHSYQNQDIISAAIYAMTLRHLSTNGAPTKFAPDDTYLNTHLNSCFGMNPPSHMFQAADLLLKMVKDELARNGITEPHPSIPKENLG